MLLLITHSPHRYHYWSCLAMWAARLSRSYQPILTLHTLCEVNKTCSVKMLGTNEGSADCKTVKTSSPEQHIKAHLLKTWTISAWGFWLWTQNFYNSRKTLPKLACLLVCNCPGHNRGSLQQRDCKSDYLHSKMQTPNKIKMCPISPHFTPESQVICLFYYLGPIDISYLGLETNSGTHSHVIPFLKANTLLSVGLV